MIEYGFTTENCNKIIDKAKIKKDGVYKFRGVGYRVRNGRVTHFSCSGNLYAFSFGFLVKAGSYDVVFGDFEGVKYLKEIR